MHSTHLQNLEKDLSLGAFGTPANCLVGFEVDYSLEAADPLNYTNHEFEAKFGHDKFSVNRQRSAAQTKVRSHAHKQISSLKPVCDEEHERQQAWLSQVGDLTLEELVMFIAHDKLASPGLSPKSLNLQAALSSHDHPQETIDFRFGSGIYQTGYYDNPGAPEIRTLPAKPSIAVARRDRIISTFQRLAQQYGLDFGVGSEHTNMSFWRTSSDRPELLHDLKTAKGIDMSCRIGSYMLAALRDAAPAFTAKADFDQKKGLYVYTVGHMRTNTIRIAPDRFEFRVGRAQGENTPRKIAAMIGGFAYAQAHEAPIGVKVMPGFGPSETFDKFKDLHVLRAIEHSTIDSQGYFDLDQAYALVRGRQILSSFTGCAIDLGLSDQSVAMLASSDLVESIKYNEQSGDLKFKPARFGAFIHRLRGNRSVIEAGGGNLDINYLNQRLKSVEFTGMQHRIEGQAPNDYLSPSTISSGLFRYLSSAILDPVIPSELREQDVCERLDWTF